jgi:hypothetical protein
MSAIAAKQIAGKRRARVEVTERVAYTRELLKAHRDDRTKIHAEFVEYFGPTPVRTVDSYIARVHDAWLADAKATAPDERAAFLAALDADLALYANAKAWGAHQGARRLQARVLGLDAQQVDVRGGLTLTPGRLPIDDGQLTDGERAELAAIAVEHGRTALALKDGDS